MASSQETTGGNESNINNAAAADDEDDVRVQVFLRLRGTNKSSDNGDIEHSNYDEDGTLEVEGNSVSIFSADQDEPSIMQLDGVWEIEDNDDAWGASSTNINENGCNSKTVVRPVQMAQDLATQCVAGRDGTLIAYGPRQTGKTRALFGTRDAGKQKNKKDQSPMQSTKSNLLSSSSPPHPANGEKLAGKETADAHSSSNAQEDDVSSSPLPTSAALQSPPQSPKVERLTHDDISFDDENEVDASSDADDDENEDTQNLEEESAHTQSDDDDDDDDACFDSSKGSASDQVEEENDRGGNKSVSAQNEGNGVDASKPASPLSPSAGNDNVKDDPGTLESTATTEEGIASQLFRHMFHLLEQEASEILSVTIRVSVVEIYLDRMTDLLFPQSSCAGTAVQLQENKRGGATVFQNCAALSCLTPDDVSNVIQHALWRRTLSHREPYRDSHRSTVVVQVKLEQERLKDVKRSSILQIVDLCASEIPIGKSHENGNAKSTAGSAVDKQIAAGILALQQEVRNPSPFSAAGERPTLARLLLPFSRGETAARVVLTGSSLDVQACRRTLDFGTACRALPPIRLPVLENSSPTNDGPETNSEDFVVREKRLTELIFALASECQKIARTSKAPQRGPVWTAISEIQKLPFQHRPLRFYVETRREHEINAEKFAMRAELREAERKAATHKHLMKQLESDIAVLKAQNEQLKQELEHQAAILEKNKHKGMKLEQRVKEVEHYLRTSQFRESEAVVFLRQFRKFYYRLLRQIHGEDESSGGSIVKHISGAPDLVELVDLDRSMVESGLMEKEEISKDISLSKVYMPSRQAMVRSAACAEKAGKVATVSTENQKGVPKNGEEIAILSDGIKTQSIVKRHETGEATEARQRIYQTPSGRYLAMREKALEEELLELSEKFAQVQHELKEEKATRIDLESTSATVNKAKHAKELRVLKDQLMRKSNDLKAVIFKMNEIHTVSRALKEKVEDREQHVQYLEDELKSMQAKEAALLTEHEELARKLREDLNTIEQRTKDGPIPIWQLSEPDSRPPPISSRIALSFAMRTKKALLDESEAEREVSQGEDDDWLDRLYDHMQGGLGARGGGIGDTSNEEVAALKRELKQVQEQLESAKSRPVKKWTKPSNTPRVSYPPSSLPVVQKEMEVVDSPEAAEEDEIDYGYGYETENFENSGHDSLQSGGGMGDVDGFLFMDEDDPVAPSKRRGSVYGGIVDAYNMQSQPPALGEDMEEEDLSLLPSSASLKELDNTSTEKQVKSVSLQNHMKRWKAPKPKADDDEQSTTPEWMKKFRTIAAKNMGESVIETSGSAEARELTRTSFGETLKHTQNHLEDFTGNRDRVYANSNNVNEDDEDDEDGDEGSDSSAPRSEQEQESDAGEGSEASDAGEGSQASKASEEAEAKSTPNRTTSTATTFTPVSPRATPTRSQSGYGAGFGSFRSSPLRTKSADGANCFAHVEDESFDPNRLKNMFAQKAANAKPLVPTGSHFNPSYSSTAKKWTPKKKKDDDSDSDDSFARGFLSGAGAVSEPEPAPTSENGSETEEEPEPEPEPEPALPAKKSPLYESDSDEDSDDDETGKKPTVVPPPNLPTKPNAPAVVSPAKKAFFDDLETEMNSDEEPQKSAPEPVKAKSFLDDSDTEVESDDEKKAKPTPPIIEAKKPEAPKPKAKKSVLDDSDSEDSSDENQSPKHSSKAAPALATLVPAKKKSFLEDSDDSESDSDGEKQKLASVPAPAASAAPPAPLPKEAAIPDKKKSFLDDSDSEDSDRSRDKPAPSSSVAAKALATSPAVPAKKKSFLQDSDSEDNSDDSGKLKRVAAATPALAPTPAQVPAPVPAKASSEDDSDSEDEAFTPEIPPAPAPVKKSSLYDDSDADDSDDDSVGMEKPPTPTPEPAPGEFSRNQYGGDDDSNSEEDYSSASEERTPVSRGDIGHDDEDESEAMETERAGSGDFSYNGDIGNSSSLLSSPVAPIGGKSMLIDSTHDSDKDGSEAESVDEEDDNNYLYKGKSTAIRNVPDFGAEVLSAIPPSLSNESGHSTKSKKKSKGTFVLKDGKLVKEEPGKAKKKPKFTIKGGKLVQDDASIRTPTTAIGGISDHKPASRRNSLDSNNDELETEKREDRADGLATATAGAAAGRRGSITAMVPATRPAKKVAGGKKSSINFVLKNGKLVKNDEKEPKKEKKSKPKAQPAAAFSIMGGKLVKADGVKKKGKKPKK